MARIPRKVFGLDPGCFHVMTRGNNKMKVFQDNLDFQHYLALLKYYKERFKVKIYAYCLMTNHVHLLIETTKPNTMPHFMHDLTLAYSRHYKYRYSWEGYLWQGRYKSYLIEKEKYLFHCIEYIEANPIAAGLISDGEDYLWCSAKERRRECYSGLLDGLGTG